MNIWKVIFVTAVIFGTGAITGGLVTRRMHWPSASHPTMHSVTNRMGQGFRPEKAFRMNFITRAKEELDLTPEQLEQIEIIRRARRGQKQFGNSVHPKCVQR